MTASAKRAFVTVGGVTRHRGRFSLGRRLIVLAVGAKTFVDLSEADFPSARLRLTVISIGATVQVIVPSGSDYTLRRVKLGRAHVDVGAELHRLPRRDAPT